MEADSKIILNLLQFITTTLQNYFLYIKFDYQELP